MIAKPIRASSSIADLKEQTQQLTTSTIPNTTDTLRRNLKIRSASWRCFSKRWIRVEYIAGNVVQMIFRTTQENVVAMLVTAQFDLKPVYVIGP